MRFRLPALCMSALILTIVCTMVWQASERMKSIDAYDRAHFTSQQLLKSQSLAWAKAASKEMWSSRSDLQSGDAFDQVMEYSTNFSTCYDKHKRAADQASAHISRNSNNRQHAVGASILEYNSEVEAIAACGGVAVQNIHALNVIQKVTTQWKEWLRNGRPDGADAKLLVFRPRYDDGLGNRLQAMLSSFVLAMISDRILVVEWRGYRKEGKKPIKFSTLPSGEEAAMWPLQSFFEVPFPHDFKQKSFLQSYPNVARGLKGSKRSDIVSLQGHVNLDGGNYEHVMCSDLQQDARPAIWVESFDYFLPALQANPRYHHQITRDFGHAPFHMLFDKLFTPIPKIQRILREWKQIFSEHYVIAMQIRIQGNRISAENEHYIFEAAAWIASKSTLKQKSPILFYLATDSPSCLDRAKAVLGQHRVRSAAIESSNLNRNSESGLQFGVVDMMLLGEADELIVCPESTYGGIAAGRVGKEAWHAARVKNGDDDNSMLVAKPAGTSPCSFGWRFAQTVSCSKGIIRQPELMSQAGEYCRVI